ncbi:drug transporter, partial [Plectosphaerella plurivora]
TTSLPLPITTRFLTLSSILPTPATSLLPPDVRLTLPPAPDLIRYESPLLWPSARKWPILAICCVSTFLTAYAAGSYSPPVAAMAVDLHASNLAVLAGISTFCLGFGFAPMALAPVSEIYGRRPVLVASGLVYVISIAVCSVMPSVAGMLIARVFVGVGGSTFSSVIGGVIADLWAKEERNTPMALFSGFVLAGTGAGPLVGAVVMGRLGATNPTLAWKWMFWHQVIAASILVVIFLLFLRETRGSVLLSRKAKALNAWYEQLESAGVPGVWLEDEDTPSQTQGEGVTPQDPEKAASGIDGRTPRDSVRITTTRLRWLVEEDEQRASLASLMKTSLLRPFHLLVAEPVVFFFSLWCAFAWAVLYLTFGSIPLAFSRRRGLNIEQSGYFFGSMIVGSIIAAIVGVFQDRLLRLPQWRADDTTPRGAFWTFMRRRFPAESPESRLYFTCITAMFLPIGLFIFGFTVRPDVHWFGPATGIALATWGIFSVYLATFNYFADIYHKYASSALAAQSCCRNILGGVFPLVTGALFTNLGEERAGALLGGIGTALSVIPWCLVFWGETIRSKSKIAISLHTQ